jgi:enoyl-CoA hydratase/carnithine racemase
MTAVSYEVQNRVAWLTINRPDARNALDADVRQGLWDGTRRFNDDNTAAVLVLTGAGDKAFCAGGDLQEMATTGLQVPPPDFLPQFGRNITVAKPTIAAVNGAAHAGGFLLAQMCDLCVAADHSTFAITESRVGRGAPWAALLPWLIPARVALELLLTGEPIGADRALDIGLANETVPLSRLRERTQLLAETIAANAPLSIRASKEMVYASVRQRDLAYEEAETIWRPVYLSEDAREGPLAFSERRRPVWLGR